MKKCLPFTHDYKYTGNKDEIGRIGDGANVFWKYRCTKCNKETWKNK